MGEHGFLRSTEHSMKPRTEKSDKRQSLNDNISDTLRCQCHSVTPTVSVTLRLSDTDSVSASGRATVIASLATGLEMLYYPE